MAAITTAPSCRVMSVPSSWPVTIGGASGSAAATAAVVSSAPPITDGDVGAALAHPARIRALGQLLPRRGHVRAHQAGQIDDEVPLELGERHEVLRPLGSREARRDRAQVELERRGELGVGRGVGAEQSLLLAVALDPVGHGATAARALEVAHRLGIHREEPHRRAVLRCHVRDRSPVGQAERAEARPVELDELVHHALLPEHLGHRKHQIGGGGAEGQLAHQLHSHDLGDEHEVRLAQHHRFRLDAAHAPADNAEAVDHGRVRVGADQRVRIGGELAELRPELHHRRQVLEVDLVDDAGARRHDPEVVERPLGELEQLVPLAVPVELQLDVELE